MNTDGYRWSVDLAVCLCASVGICGCFCLAVACAQPVAPVRPVHVELHGDVRVDEYHWMRRGDDPQVAAHLEAENAYTLATLAHLAPLRDQLRSEIQQRFSQDAPTVGWTRGPWQYYQRSEPGRTYPLYCRTPITGGAEQVLLDPNMLAGDAGYVSIGRFLVSDDGRRLAYTFDPVGDRRWILHIKDLDAHRIVHHAERGVGDVVWMADGQTLLFTRQNEDDVLPRSLWRMRLGEPPELLYLEEDERFVLHLAATRSGQFAVLTSASLTTSEVRLISRDDPQARTRLVQLRRQGMEYYVDHQADRLLIRTNDTRPGFRLVQTPIDAPGQEHWREILPTRDDVVLTSFEPFSRHVVLHERFGGVPRLRVLDEAEGQLKTIAFPEGWFAVRSEGNTDFQSRRYRFSYESTVVPPTVLEYDVDTGGLEYVHQTEVAGGYDPRDYESRVVIARLRDGTEVPVSITYRTAGQAPGPRPVVLRGYGAYGLSEDPFFSPAHASLLDRGVILATAHVRGGGEKGNAWHQAGRLHHKPQSIEDFIASAQYLVEQGIADPDRIIAHGVSAGGALVTAAMNQRPDLFVGVLVEVPFVDVLNTMLDSAQPLGPREYEEWGDPRRPEDYFVLKRWCPYTNLRPGPYPAVLVVGSMHDSQVAPWEPARFVARLRGVTTSGHGVLLWMDPASGHDGPMGGEAWIDHQAFILAWMLERLGLAKQQDKSP